MKTRLISGTFYVLILIAFYILKIFVHDFFFDGLIYFFALVGTFEMLRAVKDKTSKGGRLLATAFSVVALPCTAVLEYFFGVGLFVICALFVVYTIAQLSLLVFDYENAGIESVGVGILSGAYPSVLLAIMSLVNHAEVSSLAHLGFNSNLFILLIFVISPIADSFAYLFGCGFGKKLPKKMSPKISPNKTVIGGVGGLFGGIVGACAVYFSYNAIAGSYENTALWLSVYIGIGLVVALVTAFGDLVESAIKRKVGVKDMGKIMPGHGGVLDRIAGSVFASLIIYLCYTIVSLAV